MDHYEHIKRKFDWTDEDNDNALDLEEFTNFQFPRRNKKYHFVWADETWAYFDLDSNGRVEMQEFIHFHMFSNSFFEWTNHMVNDVDDKPFIDVSFVEFGLKLF